VRRAAAACLAAALAALPGTSGAIGSMQPAPNKDFRELIVAGERPEIAACLAAAIERARSDPAFSAVRWGDAASDRAVMREREQEGKRVRTVHLVAQMRVRGAPIAVETWRRVDVNCVQPEDGSVQVEMKALNR
jgi:hypothetical protein